MRPADATLSADKSADAHRGQRMARSEVATASIARWATWMSCGPRFSSAATETHLPLIFAIQRQLSRARDRRLLL